MMLMILFIRTPLHSFAWQNTDRVVGASLLANPVGASSAGALPVTPSLCPIREQARSHKGFAFIPPSSLPTTAPVGAGLPAMAPFLSHQWRLCRHHRWQASSHRVLHSSRNLTAYRRPCGSWLASDGALPVTSMAPVPTSSLASRIVEPQLPQVLHSSRQPHCPPQTLWELACQRWGPFRHINGACADLIAGKSNRRTAAPTGFAFIPPSSLPTTAPVGAGLPAMAPFQSHQWRLCRPHRWQVESSNRSSHRFCIHPAYLTAHRRPCGSWLASDGALSVTSMAPVPPSSLASRIVEPQLPQVLHSSRHPHYQPQPLWELACQRWRPSSHINGACADLIAGKPAPTRICIYRHLAFVLLLPLRCRFRFVGYAQQSP
jgi:hypothetical protein